MARFEYDHKPDQTGKAGSNVTSPQVIMWESNNNNNDNKAVKESSLGKTPHCYQCTFGEDFVLYKDYVLKNDEEVFCGLYRLNLNDNKDSGMKTQLLSDSYFAIIIV